MRARPLLPIRSDSSSWPSFPDMRQAPLKGGPPKNLEPVQSTIQPLSKCSRTSLSPMRPWQASTTGTTSLPWVSTRWSRHALDGIHLPVLLPTTMCTTMQPYLSNPSASLSAAAAATASSTFSSRSFGVRSRPEASRMKRFTPVKKRPPGTAPKPSAEKMQLPSGVLPEGKRLAKSWPVEACNVPEPTSPAATTTLQTSEPRPGLSTARVTASSEGMSSASVPEGNRLMLSSHDSPKTDRSRSRMSHSNFRNRSSGDE
mmetsp:Transcript_51647/g.162010  ORF Transcript_51647/g.162010 Transcript_51647/m.162010 type:complete len:258 (+) Transcript_51647:1122-1895(+)